MAGLDDDSTTGPAIDVSVEDEDEDAAFDVDDVSESEPPPDTEVESERETLRADDVIATESDPDSTPTDPIATRPMPVGYQEKIERQQASGRAAIAAGSAENAPATERRDVAIVESLLARSAESTSGPNDDTQPEGIRARASEPPPEVDPEDMEIHEAGSAGLGAPPRTSSDAKKPPPPKAVPPLQARGAALAAAVQAQSSDERRSL